MFLVSDPRKRKSLTRPISRSFPPMFPSFRPYMFTIIFIHFWLYRVFTACRPFSGCGEQRLPFLAVTGCSLWWPALLQSVGWRALASAVAACGLESPGLTVAVHRLSCSVACGIFLDEGSSPCLLHWLAESSPLSC